MSCEVKSGHRVISRSLQKHLLPKRDMHPLCLVIQAYQIDFKIIIVPDRFQRPYMVLNRALILRILNGGWAFQLGVYIWRGIVGVWDSSILFFVSCLVTGRIFFVFLFLIAFCFCGKHTSLFFYSAVSRPMTA